MDVQSIQNLRNKIQNKKDAMKEHLDRKTRDVYLYPNAGGDIIPYGKLVTGMVAKVKSVEDVKKILFGRGISGFEIGNGGRIVFSPIATNATPGQNVRITPSGGESNRRSAQGVVQEFIGHLHFSQIAPIEVNRVNNRTNGKVVTDLQSLLGGTHRLTEGQPASCWLTSLLHDPRRRAVLFGDRTDTGAVRGSAAVAFIKKLKLQQCPPPIRDR